MTRWKRLVAVAAIAALACVDLVQAQSGPNSQSSETVARPRPQTQEPAASDDDQSPIPSVYNRSGQPEVIEGSPVFRSDVTTVTVDVSVLNNQGQFIPGIPQGNFRVLEDGVPQKITDFSVNGEAPITVCLVIEFSNLFQQYWSETWYQTLTAANGFIQTLKPEDYVAVVAYDIRPEILTDFTTDRREVQAAMQRLQIAAYRESNLFDAVTDTAERMSDIEGRKAIVLISSGIDTLSGITFGQTRKRLQGAGVPIYSIGLMQSLRDYYDSYGGMNGLDRMAFLQADNQLRTFSNETGGQSFFPRFYGEFPEIFASISDALRNQYSLAYHPSNQARDGQFRKIEVKLVNPENGDPLRIVDQKNKQVKYKIIAKKGYTAPREVE